jgi:hypothetical protein
MYLGCVLSFNNVASSYLLERDYFIVPSSNCHLLNENTCQSSSNYAVQCPSSTSYQPPLPQNLTYNGIYYGKILPSEVNCADSMWGDDCTVEFCHRQSQAYIRANSVMSIPFIISICLSPFSGGFVDKYGMRAVIATIAPMTLILVQSLLGFSRITAVLPMVLQGMAYAAFSAAIWPSISFVVEKKDLGDAYGIAYCMINVGLAIFPLIVATLYGTNNNTYRPDVNTFFVVMACCGTLVGIYLNVYDYQNNKIFNSPTAYSQIQENKSSGKLEVCTEPREDEYVVNSDCVATELDEEVPDSSVVCSNIPESSTSIPPRTLPTKEGSAPRQKKAVAHKKFLLMST